MKEVTRNNRRWLFPWLYLIFTGGIFLLTYVAAPLAAFIGYFHGSSNLCSAGTAAFVIGVPGGVLFEYLAKKSFDDDFRPPWKFVLAKSASNILTALVWLVSVVFYTSGAQHAAIAAVIAALVVWQIGARIAGRWDLGA